MRIRLLLVDGEALFRQELKALLKTDPGLEIIGEAATGREAVEKAAALEPDLVVMEIRLPDAHSIAAIRTIRVCCPRTQVLILTSRADLGDLRRAADAGAIGYAVKDTDSATLAEAIRSAAAGRKTLSPSLEHPIEQHFGATKDAGIRWGGMVSGRQPRLMQRGVEGLAKVAHGLDDSLSQAKLFFSLYALKTRLGAIYQKRGLSPAASAD
jgi:DNA-binding NarL/FixJ family response regulator